jgi:uncharacterized protein YjbI with pentapeptide repeats
MKTNKEYTSAEQVITALSEIGPTEALRGARLLNIDFTKTDPFQNDKIISLEGAYAKNCDFNGQTLRWNVTDAEFDKCTWRNATIVSLEAVSTRFTECDFRLAKTEYPFKAKMPNKANFHDAIISECDFSSSSWPNGIDFGRASIFRSQISNAVMRNASFAGAYLSEVKFENSLLENADFRGMIPYYVDFSGATLIGANLEEIRPDDNPDKTWAAAWSRITLASANISGATGIPDPLDWMNANFERTEKGWIVYKRFGDTPKTKPASCFSWGELKEGKELHENVCSAAYESCACGVNFATLEWIYDEYGRLRENSEIWQCLLPFERSVSLVVPYGTTGKARCNHLVLIRKMLAIELETHEDEYDLDSFPSSF